MREVFLKHDTHSLGGERPFQIAVHVIGMIVGFQSDFAAFGQLIFKVELTHEVVLLLVGIVSVAEASVEQQAVVEQLAREQHLHFCILYAVVAGADIRSDLYFIRQTVEDAGYL